MDQHFSFINDAFTTDSSNTIPIFLVTEGDSHWTKDLSCAQINWAKSLHFMAKKGSLCLFPRENGSIEKILFSPDRDSFWTYAHLRNSLPFGTYAFENLEGYCNPFLAAFAWGLAGYRFQRYQSTPDEGKKASWCLPKTLELNTLSSFITAVSMVRDLISTPRCDMNPQTLEDFCQDFSKKLALSCIVHKLPHLQQDFPSIYTVGKGAEHPPRLVEMNWKGTRQSTKNQSSKDQSLKKLCLIGKGVCFDTGGLQIKSGTGMHLMKKDMGGAANILGLAQLIIGLNLPVDLKILLPIVENAVSPSAMHPLDVIRTRKGTTVEIGHTDAEGRLILSDSLTYACEWDPDLIIDCATLTGSARVAMGTEIPAFFTNTPHHQESLLRASQQTQDPVWPLPLYAPYKKMLKSSLADISNDSNSSYGGAITAALFLEHFVDTKIPWIHLDMMAYNLSTAPGRPEGGEAMGIRALTAFLEEWVGN